MTLVAIKHINPNEQLKWMEKTSVEMYKKEHIELRWRKNNRMHKRLQKLNLITNMQTCWIKWIKTVRSKKWEHIEFEMKAKKIKTYQI
jgi:hypothetical protein